MASPQIGKFWPGDQLVTASGPSRGSTPRVPEDDSSPRSHVGASPNRQSGVSIDRARDLRSQEAAQRQGGGKLLESMHCRYEKERSLTKPFHEYPERLQSYLTRAEAAFVDATLGQLWEEVVPLCAYL